MSNPGSLHDWIEALPGHGRYAFSRADAWSVSKVSSQAAGATLRRLKKRGQLSSPRRGFYVLVPPEYRAAGCPPASWFIDDLMKHLGRHYYVALLSAAALHGAGHQQPMAFQVIVDADERDIEVGRVRIELHSSRLTRNAATQRIQTETGTMLVSTPETTAFDLVRFPSAAGSWSNIATVLLELAEKLDPKLLAAGSTRVARSETQRLGWLLDFLEEGDLAESLGAALQGKRLVPTPLTTTLDASDAPLDPRWQILVNDEVVLSRALVEMFGRGGVAERAVFRGGTALHKLYLDPPGRYSEDIDLVQKKAGPIGPLISEIRLALDPWLGEPKRRAGEGRFTLIYRFTTTFEPVVSLRLKVEINTREHFAVHGFISRKLSVVNPWFGGEVAVTTFTLSELLATKLRALHQRKKGRDLFDLALGLTHPSADPNKLTTAFDQYMRHGGTSVSRAQFEESMAAKMIDSGFLDDTPPLLRTGLGYDPADAWARVHETLVTKLPGSPWKGAG